MMRLATCCLLLVGVFAPILAAESAVPELIGKPAPIVVLKTLDGKDFYLRDYCGKIRGPRHRQEREVVVLSFFTSWCKNCKNEIPVLQQLASEMAGLPVKFYLVNVGQPRDTVENYVFQNVTTLPVLMDQYEVASKKYKVKELPTLVMIDQDGILREYHTGFLPAYGDSIRLKVRSLLGMGQAGNSGHAAVKPDSTMANTVKVAPKPVVKKKKTKK
ncbi:MAG: TlpA family protein disulfide reductase [Candidatus Edwardsbacteria bacterium]|nr:TlpA family protein disulfide reductase [Candidatus Edwardsbacteria bacterium]MBU1576928.1 TlpA family protein disulfide reductase [Candidatus Edwardsbacteria bacterium]MBU2463074.1 TlpA family protein disulfide reductase [Candidatus Edwardsbacteria bacterium]MBU2594290.1 TlpA family protein disulfide reductase [Candidatus Edwardsbacteria bacterium]